MGCLIIVPPYITAAMPNSESYPALLFFGVYLLFCIFINNRYLFDADEADQQQEMHPPETKCNL